MNLGEAVCQVPLTWPLRVSQGLPKDFGLFRSGSREGEPGRKKMIDSMVLRPCLTLDKSHPLAGSLIPPTLKEGIGLGDSSQLPDAPIHWKNIYDVLSICQALF